MTKQIPLSQGKFALVDDDMYEYLSQWKWYAQHKPQGFYACRSLNGKKIYMHTIINETPKGYECDHKNRNTLDDRRSNLRNATHSENMANRITTKNSTGERCVQKTKNSYQVKIKKDGNYVYVKTFPTIDLAKKARDIALKLFHGSFSNNQTKGS